MTLEDHVGDVVHKARQAAGVSAAAAARAAGLTGSELAELEQTGEVGRAVDFNALGRAVGLDPAKLEDLARGWLPQGRPLSLWRELRQVSTAQGGNTVNAFLIWDAESREAALFDTGWDAAPLFALLEQNRLVLRHVLITHSHHDHVAALPSLREWAPDLVLHSGRKSAGPDPLFSPGEGLSLGRLRIGARPVPGHAEDGAAFVVEGWPGDPPPVAVVGDTLFAGSLARGFISPGLLRREVQAQILSLPPRTLVCPGHGPVTTVEEELAHNPFF